MREIPRQKTVVVGAGPVGALAALYAAQRGHEVEIYELRSGMFPTGSVCSWDSAFRFISKFSKDSFHLEVLKIPDLFCLLLFIAFLATRLSLALTRNGGAYKWESLETLAT